MGLSIFTAYALNFAIQVGCFVPAYFLKTDKFYDLTGAITHILITALSLLSLQSPNTRQVIQASMVILWAFRLGLFLFVRVIASNGDRRFKVIIPFAGKFLKMWILQGVWVCLNTLPTFLCLFNSKQPKLSMRDYIGWGLFIAGFLFEVIADYQKTAFRKNPANKNKFISHGLWSISRHPNYFGEILLWFGLYLSASSTFLGLQYLSVMCPILVYMLITRVSGIPNLEKMAKQKWASNAQYQIYVRNTSPLVPFWNSY